MDDSCNPQRLSAAAGKVVYRRRVEHLRACPLEVQNTNRVAAMNRRAFGVDSSELESKYLQASLKHHLVQSR